MPAGGVSRQLSAEYYHNVMLGYRECANTCSYCFLHGILCYARGNEAGRVQVRVTKLKGYMYIRCEV